MVDGLLNSSTFKSFVNNEALKENPKALGIIEITDDNNNVWEVCAGQNHFHYKLNDVRYDKVGRKNIFEITEARIPGLLYDPENLNPILSVVDEDSGLFPIDRPDTQIFKTYERLLSLSCTEDILRAIKLDTEDLELKCSNMLTSMQQYNEQLIQINNLEKDININELHKLKDSLSTSFLKLKELQKDSEISKINDEYISILKKDTELSNDFDVSMLENLAKDFVLSKDLKSYIDACSELYTFLETFDVSFLSNLLTDAINAKNLIDETNKTLELINKDSKELEDINKIIKTIEVCPYCGHKMR